MSTICGLFNLDGTPVKRDLLHGMVESSLHRDHDGIGYWWKKNIGFAHIGFHITPESVDENQPIVSSDNRLSLVADVRLDNRDELVGKLSNVPENPTDPDLLMAAYRKWGTECVEHLLGDFAFAIWDGVKRELFLARDPMGTHGLFYYRSGNLFLFASEIAAILDFPRMEVNIDEISVTKHLLGLGCEQDETFFQSIFLCPPAHCITISKQGYKRYRYWDIDPDFRIRYRNNEEYTDHFLHLFHKAVSCRMRSIHPIGLSLSGGCDSTLLAAVASELLPGKDLPQSRLKSFSYVFDKFPECDERRYIQPVVNQYDIAATFITADDKIPFSNMSQHFIYKGFFSYDCYAQLPNSTAEAARKQGCRAVLNGFYGDTLFDMPSYFIADALWEKNFVGLYKLFRQYTGHIDWKNHVIRDGLKPLFPQTFTHALRKIRPRPLDGFNPGVAPERIRALKKHLQELLRPSVNARLSPGRRQRYNSLTSSAWPVTFAIGRRIYLKGFGIERISPYFDRRLLEFVLAIPPDQISRPGHHRFLQKNAMRRLLPARVCNRTEKTSLETLLVKSMQNHRRTVVRQFVKDPLIVKQGWVRPDWLWGQLQARYPEKQGFPLSTFFYLELWLKAVEVAKSDGSWADLYHIVSNDRLSFNSGS
jgi:asparagine synthase (glutamine-hydrolysing)